MNFTVSILRGDDTHSYRNDAEFIDAWKVLAARTPHVTAFQEPEFVNTWYQDYASKYEPVLVVGTTNKQKLIGLLPLAIEKDTNELTFAGAQHVEYSAWLSESRYAHDFIMGALHAVKNEIKFTSWRWSHLPPNADDAWLLSSKMEQIGVYVLSESAACPILDLHDEEKLSRILKNKSIKSKINRLKRNGELRIERIDNSERVAQLMDQITNLVNFRHESAHHDAAFEEEPLQKDFYLNRATHSSANHYTALWMGDILLAFNFGVKDADTVYIGLTAFDPTQSKHSPGVIFLIYLANVLKEENIRYIDFTPGGDEYKERFCNSYNNLQRPTFYSSKFRQSIINIKSKSISLISHPIRLFISKWNSELEDLVMIPDQGPTTEEKFDVYTINRSDYKNLDERSSERVNIQFFQDLLFYNSKNSKISRQQVLADATKRFSREETVFTILTGDELLAHSWMSKLSLKYKNHGIEFKPGNNSVVLDCLNQTLHLPKGPIFKCVVNCMLEYAFENGADTATIFIPKAYASKTQADILKEFNFSR